MELGFFDFPLKKENDKIFSKSGKLIVDLRNSQKEDIDEFLKLLLLAANYGKRFFIKRISRCYPVSLKECEDIAIMDANRMGFVICSQSEATMEYIVTSTKQALRKSKKLYFKNKQ